MKTPVDDYQDQLDDGKRTPVLRDYHLKACHYSGVDFRCACWINCELEDVWFVECDLRGANFQESRLKNVHLVQCLTYGCTLPSAEPPVVVTNCDHTFPPIAGPKPGRFVVQTVHLLSTLGIHPSKNKVGLGTAVVTAFLLLMFLALRIKLL